MIRSGENPRTGPAVNHAAGNGSGSQKALRLLCRCSLLILTLLCATRTAYAHVKWYSEFSFADRPLTLEEALTQTFLALAIFSMLAMAGLTLVDYRLQKVGLMQRMDAWLEGHRANSQIVMRVGLGAVMLLSWQANAMLVPELDYAAEWIGWCQFGLAFLLLLRRTTPIAGAGLVLLYSFGIAEFGILHMLDYLLYAGVGIYLSLGDVRNQTVQSVALPALYFTLGFSLCWVALEKIIYPEWGLSVLATQPHLTMGFDAQFFLTGSAFVEFSLGYLLIIGLMQRPVSLLITFVFFMTTLTFGKLEIIGHTLIHAALIVLLIEGPGKRYSAPYTFHQKPLQRVLFAAFNFALLLALMIVPYANSAQTAYLNGKMSHQAQLKGAETGAETGAESGAVAEEQVMHMQHPIVESANPAAPPSLKLEVVQNNSLGLTLNLQVKNFRFAPQAADGTHVDGQGHVHLYHNKRKVGRVYSEWFHLPTLKPGTHLIRATLNSNDHRDYAVNGHRVESIIELNVAANGKIDTQAGFNTEVNGEVNGEVNTENNNDANSEADNQAHKTIWSIPDVTHSLWENV